MKLGIITYHRAHNYGAILQAIALRMILKKLGHEVYYIDYWPDYHKEAYSFFSFRKLVSGKLQYLKSRLVLAKEIKNRIRQFDIDISKYILPFCMPYVSSIVYDYVIYGSDQIWRTQSIGHVNPVYFGQNRITAKKHITYAASMGVLVSSKDEITNIKIWLEKFYAISVRENDLKNYLLSLGYNSTLVLDPTLLLTSSEWDRIMNLDFCSKSDEDEYVLYYNLNEDVFDYDAVKKFARIKKLRLIELKGHATKDTDEIISQCGPRQFVSLIRGAKYILTTSYHGLAFSIIYHKDFYVSFNKNINRALTLLENLNLKDRLIAPKETIIPSLAPIEYTTVDSKIGEMRLQSLGFLQTAIKE